MMKRLFLFFVLITLLGGCSGFRITNLPDRYIKTKLDQGERTRTTTTEVKGKVVGKVTTTDRWRKEKVTTRPFRWQDSGGYGRRLYR